MAGKAYITGKAAHLGQPFLLLLKTVGLFTARHRF